MLPNVHMRCDIADIATPIMVDSADGEQLAIYALPYLDPDLARPALQGLLNSVDVLSSSAKVSDSAESDKRRETNTIRRSHEGLYAPRYSSSPPIWPPDARQTPN